MDESASVTVLAVDDQEVFRRAMASLIEATPGFEQVGEAASGSEALVLAAELKPDLVLLDVRMPGMDGFETARRVAEVDARIAVVLTSLDAVPQPDAAPTVVFVRKQDLSTRKLHELWAAVSTRG